MHWNQLVLCDGYWTGNYETGGLGSASSGDSGGPSEGAALPVGGTAGDFFQTIQWSTRARNTIEDVNATNCMDTEIVAAMCHHGRCGGVSTIVLFDM